MGGGRTGWRGKRAGLKILVASSVSIVGCSRGRLDLEELLLLLLPLPLGFLNLGLPFFSRPSTMGFPVAPSACTPATSPVLPFGFLACLVEPSTRSSCAPALAAWGLTSFFGLFVGDFLASTAPLSDDFAAFLTLILLFSPLADGLDVDMRSTADRTGRYMDSVGRDVMLLLMSHRHTGLSDFRYLFRHFW